MTNTTKTQKTSQKGNRNNSLENSVRRQRPFYKTPSCVALVIGITLVVGIAVGLLAFGRAKKTQNDDSSNDTSVSQNTSPHSSSSQETDKITGTTPNSDGETDGKTPVQYDGENPNSFDSLTGNITYVGFSGEKFMIRISIDQYLSSGTCSLTISDGDNSFEETATIIPEASTSTCEGFDIPKSDLSLVSDNIEILINISSGDKTGTITGVATL